MISLEQVKALETRVERAVAYIAALREENAALSTKLAEERAFVEVAAAELEEAEAKTAKAEAASAAFASAAEASATKVEELEARNSGLSERILALEMKAAELASLAEEYRRDQARIEEGIIHALEKLDAFEDLILGTSEAKVEVKVSSVAAALSEDATLVSAPATDATAIEEPKEPETQVSQESPDRPKAQAKTASQAIEPHPSTNELDIF